MVLNVSPTYYAANVSALGFDLFGRYFNVLPNDAVGVIATNNDNPIEHIESSVDIFFFKIEKISDLRLRLYQDNVHSFTNAVYVGAIVSADRQTIYWQNDTKPLP